MPGYAARITESTEIEGAVIAAAPTGALATDAIDLSRCRRHVATVTVPTLAGGATIDAGLYWSATKGGSYVLVTGTSITQEATGDKVFQIEVTTDAITNFAATAKWMIGYLTVGSATAPGASMVIRGFYPRYLPGTDKSTIAQTPVILG